jgi:tRNA-specific 2-thiouridylase
MADSRNAESVVKGQHVVVAMSGGVDSSVAATLLVEQGYDVSGVGLNLPRAAGECDSAGEMEDGGRVAEQLGIPFEVLDYRALFEREVIEPFCQAYSAGRTPNPCVTCNVRIKFGALLERALAQGADYLATGHYARVRRSGAAGFATLHRGRDAWHDQSYFLYALSPDVLAHVLFPLGEMKKKDVRQIARERGLGVSDRPSSQDICFAAGRDYRELLAGCCAQAFQPGRIVDAAGKELGRHNGIGNYTIGQRKGLGVAAAERLYVIGIDAASNTVTVGTKAETGIRRIEVEDVRWSGGRRPEMPMRLGVKTRYRSAATMADVTPAGNGAVVQFAEQHDIAAPGQSAVFYDGDMVVGGGVIER